MCVLRVWSERGVCGYKNEPPPLIVLQNNIWHSKDYCVAQLLTDSQRHLLSTKVFLSPMNHNFDSL